MYIDAGSGPEERGQTETLATAGSGRPAEEDPERQEWATEASSVRLTAAHLAQ